MNDVVLPTEQEARALTDRIKVAVEGTWLLIQEAYTSRAWAALGYETWDAYCTAEFGTTRLRLPREERQEVVASLRESGLSVRAIASATGNSTRTVQKDLQVSSSTTPEIRGTDGKTYAPSRSEAQEDDDLLDGDDWVQPNSPGFEAAITPTPAPERAPDRQPRIDASRTVLVALTELRQARESLEALTEAQLARQDEETRRIWAARLNTELEALHGFHNSLIKENNQ